MKDSGIEWIGEIPEGWEVKKIGTCYSERNTKVSDKDYPPLSVTKNGILPQLETAAKTDNGENRKLVCSGDFVINSRSDRKGSCGISKLTGSTSLINIVLSPQQEINNYYFSFVFKSTMFADEFFKWGNGIVDDLWSTKWSSMKKISVPFPPLTEQQRIADYLDAKCAHIDQCLELTRQSMEKLRAYKLSCITEAVTKGLDPDAPLKDSSLWWTPKIPQHWDIEKIGWNFSIELGKMLDSKKLLENNLYHYLRNIDIKWGEINYNNLPLMSFTDDEKQRFQLKVGDLLVCEGGDIGRCAIVHNLPDFPVFYQKAIHRVREISKNKIYYLRYILFCMSKNDYFSCTSNKSTIAHLPAETFKQLRIPLPPLPEQERIAAYLDKKCARIDALLEEKQALLDKLAEYKKA